MHARIIDGSTYKDEDRPYPPNEGEQVRIVVPGARTRDLRVQSRIWVFEPGQPPRVDVECA
ncbi:MAG: hypothetical protein ACK4SZ_02065 [Allosphingosinicella sp.]|uniref:hypothetical protein n=1 Tax=Allosphingosinicella sp. TaxID=2823234 RepID=UPI003922ABF6